MSGATALALCSATRRNGQYARLQKDTSRNLVAPETASTLLTPSEGSSSLPLQLSAIESSAVRSVVTYAVVGGGPLDPGA